MFLQGYHQCKEPLANVGDTVDQVQSQVGRSPSGGGHGQPSQYSNLENPMERVEAFMTMVQ